MIKPSAKPYILPFKPKAKDTQKRPRSRSRVSIVSVFSGQSGTVLCADSQETYGSAKQKVDKITVTQRDEFSVAIGAAGRGHYADMLAFDLRYAIADECAQNGFDPARIIEFTRDKLRVFHDQHGIQRDENLVELIIAIQKSGEQSWPFVLHALETAVNLVGTASKTIGVGSYLADFLLDSLLTGYGGKELLIATAAYVLKTAEEYVEGCGGPPVVYFFDYHRGNMERVPEDYIERLQKLTGNVNETLKTVYGEAMDVGHYPDMDYIEDDVRGLWEVRRKALADFQSEQEYWRNFYSKGEKAQ